MMSDYIKRLRKLVGNEFLLLPSVSVIVEDHTGSILMVRHHHNDWWVLPGGMIEPNETPQQTAIREAKEETGYDISLREIYDVFGGPEFQIQYTNGDRVGYVMIVFKASIESGKPKADNIEIHEVKFIDPKEIETINKGKWVHTVLSSLFK